MVFEKRAYQPLREDIAFEWHQNKVYPIITWYIVILVAIMSIFIIIFCIPKYPDYRPLIFSIIFSTPIFLVLMLKRTDIPRRVGIFNNGVVFDYNGKYEYIFWLEIESYYEQPNPMFPATIKKRDGSIKYLNLVYKDINAIIRIKIYEHFHMGRYNY